ncbi:sensor histidine kinase [Marinactinospora thermotolerans]|uniref:sensor histidine kinase n=1 Tax=Marinactinospora thermotolerans TaxID=531310 RepID=UPI003D929037
MTESSPSTGAPGDILGSGGAAGPPWTGAFDATLNRLGLRSALARDCLLAVVMAVASGVLLRLAMDFLGSAEGIEIPSSAATAVTVAACAQSLMLCVRRSNPVLCLAATALAQVAIAAFLPPHVAAQGVAPLIAAYTCGILVPQNRLVRLLAAVILLHTALATLVTGTLSDPALGLEALPSVRPSTSGEYLVLAAGLLVSTVPVYAGPAFLGAYAGTRRRYTDLLRARAVDAIQRQHERAEAAIKAERTRMARELHDIAAHHLSGMVVQAAAAERLIGRDDQAAREATAWVRAQGRRTLDSLRLVVGALRDPGEDPAPSGTDLMHSGDPSARGAPVPGAGEVETLVRIERELGAQISFGREGAVYPLPPVADVTVYRVAQEALSNAREHAAGAEVRLLLHYGTSRLVLQVDNEEGAGRAERTGQTAGAPRGLGLLGMRERAHLVGATLETGPMDGGGWRVRLSLPVDREISAAAGREAAEGSGV